MSAKTTPDNEPASAEFADQYSVFTTPEKWCIVAMVAYATWFSGLSSFIYFPAIHDLSQALSVSIDDINLTVTSYLAVATVAPALFGDFADVLGRRPVYLITLTLYFVANLSIALSKSYSALLGLRALQALAISGTNSFVYGVIADIATPAERGSFVSGVSFSVTIGPAVGPIIGGLLTYAVGWSWIFWFLCIAGALCLLLIALFLPETCRNVVGNGSIPPPKYLRLPSRIVMCHWSKDNGVARYKWQIPNPLRSIRILLRKDNAVVMLAAGLLYLVYTCNCTSLSVLFVEIYGLKQWQISLVYLPFGIGAAVSTFFSGPMMDAAYRHARSSRGLPTNKAAGDDLDTFPIEKARLGIMWPVLSVTVLTLVAHGWVLEYRQHIAIPLCLQFILGLCLQFDFSIYNTLLTDKNHRAAAAAQAASNIVRCTLATVSVAFLQPMMEKIGSGWTFTLFGGLCLTATGLFCIDYHKGTAWRQQNYHNASSSGSPKSVVSKVTLLAEGPLVD
ncbi:multidrug resistance protein [Coniochaeta ligniaria NRRL 30616]|uniref:Multidrug resistance protein n=1 Tax=Coniochaeta ligniaria NRRL 30616 TaxID=1408157 RepID=A0A1J7JXL2_9PEZI|nr:multidrug resistance protein [Coniochaeta ligniaria NRRL 30616]